MTSGSMFLAFLAGVLSILSPCVLPILPIVLGAASSAERLGPIALAAGYKHVKKQKECRYY